MNGDPGVKYPILTKYDPKYWYYPINFEVIFGKNVGI